MNDNLYDAYVDKLNNCFVDSFKKVYSSIKRRGKTKVLYYTECIYKRWYYSTFFEETILSPSNLQYRLGEKFLEEAELKIPIFKPVSTKAFTGFNISMKKYNNHDHPIIRDLKIFLENCTPEIRVVRNNMLSDKDRNKVIRKVTIFDPFYLQYLLLLAIELKLLNRLPSIYSKFFHVTKRKIDFFKRNNNEILHDIVEAAINVAITNLDNGFPLVRGVFDRDLIIKLIIDPMPIDDMFKKIYSFSGIGVEEIWNVEVEAAKGADNIVLSSTYFIGILLDKWLLTPFGHYLKFIQPIYILQYKFKEEVEALCDTLENGQLTDFFSNLYTPCSQYFTTTLGEEFFGSTEKQKLQDFKELPIEEVIDLVLDDIKNNTCNSLNILKTQVTQIYQVKIKDISNKRYWKVLEIQENKTLHSLFFEVCKMFGLDSYFYYSVFLDENFNPFNEYTSPNKTKRTSKKTDKTLLSDLKLEKGQKFIFKIGNNQEFSTSEKLNSMVLLEVEILNIYERTYGKLYPRVVKKSKLAKEIDRGF